MAERTCAWCEASFEVNKVGRRRRTCSTECANSLRAEQSKAAGKRWAEARRSAKMCDVCFGPVPPGRSKRCSTKCAMEATRHLTQGWPANACALNIRSCTECGDAFVARKQTTGSARRRCDRCTIPEADRLRAKRAARVDAVRSGEIVRLADLARRDGDRCQLCRQPVDMDRKHPDPESASLDHIIPLSQGGEHTMRNAQLAHLGCNMSKGARPSGEQLRLVG